MADHDKQAIRWYTRREGVTRGPYPAGLISRYILLGRIRDSDELRCGEGGEWRPLSAYPELIPELMKLPPTEENRQKLLMARLREDERRPGDRRLNQGAWDVETLERRSRQERRSPESEAVRHHRELKRRFLVPPQAEPHPYRYPLLLAAAVVAGFLLGLLVQRGAPPEHRPDCGAAPAAGINWDNCNLSGARIAGADLGGASIRNAHLDGVLLAGAGLAGARLDYSSLRISDLQGADLRGAVLIGAVLSGADLRNARFDNANLAYTNLSGAQIEGARFDGAILDQAIWTDQRMCARGSRGRCRRASASGAE